MENVNQQMSIVLVVHQMDDDDHTNDNAGGLDVVVNREEQEQQLDVQDPIMETDDDDDDDEDDDEEEYEGEEEEQPYEEYEGEEGEYEGGEYEGGEYEGESDNESCTSCVSPKRFEFFSADGLFELPKGDKEYNMITEKFLADLGELGINTTVLAVQKNMFLGPIGQARMESFQIFTQAMAKKRQGHANVKCAWYGSSKDDISGILSYGFGKCEKPANDELAYGLGIYLTPQEASVDRIMSSPIDENGIRHVLLCRVILGNLEQVLPGSEQFHPSSEQFDSGVDNLFFPKKYIVWSTNMNTHIFPEHVISYRAPISLEGCQRPPKSPVMRPNSAWMPFGTLILMLSRCLHPVKVTYLKKHHAAFRDRKITRAQLIQIVRHTAGDHLLAKVIKSCKAKGGSEASTSGGP